jgi:thymidylate synthase ThyX
MKITQVSLTPTEQATDARRPALTPELLAASGARYSRNNEGLEAILAKIDPDNMDRSVDTIFRLIDYGHQSIADMVPVAIFIDDISIWLAYHVWSLCPTAGGQESSTRYIKLNPGALVPAERLGIPADYKAEWMQQMEEAFVAYRDALDLWETIGENHFELTAIPQHILNDTSEKGQRTRDRMQRNFRFDRARYYIPAAASTNMMLVMSARGWTRLCQHLCSHPLPEAQALGNGLRTELGLSAPRLLKHACRNEGIANGIQAEFTRLAERASTMGLPTPLQPSKTKTDADDHVELSVYPPPDLQDGEFAKDLQQHDNRYGWIGSQLQRTLVRCNWSAISMAEIRDMNRHRTGSKHCPLIPVGFYAAVEKLPQAPSSETEPFVKQIKELTGIGQRLSAEAFQRVAAGDPTAIYHTLLGTQFAFERTTQADKFIYEAELRTGLGAHFRYAKHYKDALTLWYAQHPETQGLILEGNAEPE